MTTFSHSRNSLWRIPKEEQERRRNPSWSIQILNLHASGCHLLSGDALSASQNNVSSQQMTEILKNPEINSIELMNSSFRCSLNCFWFLNRNPKSGKDLCFKPSPLVPKCHSFSRYHWRGGGSQKRVCIKKSDFTPKINMLVRVWLNVTASQ